MTKVMKATFDHNDHCNIEGWATYHGDQSMFRWRLRCALGHHSLPDPPTVRDGIRPDNYDRCPRCRAWVKWFVVGQHRFGSIGHP